jgi:hypothetical protein
MVKRKRKKGDASQSWARARKLSELAGVGTVTLARSFIAEEKEYGPLLDGRADKRNKKVREMITGFTKWSKKR